MVERTLSKSEWEKWVVPKSTGGYELKPNAPSDIARRFGEYEKELTAVRREHGEKP